LKQCQKCWEVKEDSAFRVTAKTPEGFGVYCQACRKRLLAVRATQRWIAVHPEENKAQRKIANATWRAAHPEASQMYDRQKRERKPELYRAIDKAKQLAKPELYRPMNAAKVRRYQAAKIQRTPAWAEHEKIGDFFAQAQAAREFFGGEWHVDHMYPLQGKWVSGLHVHENLQVLPGLENRKKSARRVQVEFRRKDMRDLVRAAQ
jgi:hypothetical protein